MKPMKAIITVGISASGKTTWAEKLCDDEYPRWVNSNRDRIRFEHILWAYEKPTWADYKFNKTNENKVTEIQEQYWEYAAQDGKNLIVSDTNLNTQRREVIKAKLEALGYEVEFKFFPITLEEAWRRDAARPNGVGRDVIYKQWQQWNETIGRPTYKPNLSLPRAVIFDIDGTLVHMNGKRGPFDWDKVHLDDVDSEVRFILWSYEERRYFKIILLSGRDGSCRENTEKWLKDNYITYTALFMRDEGDMRKDSIIKEELFFRNIAPYYNVVAVFDDRPQVIRMWNDIKIPKVFACANQHLEF